MQIRLTVVDPLGPISEPRGRATACDVLVTAPAGTALAAVASGLASAVGGEGGAPAHERGREPGGGQVVLYAGAERLDAQRCTLGEPPLIDGAVLSLGAPTEAGPEADEAAAQLHVVAGPDAGGVHLLHGGKIHIGRSADADVPLDDPDVSRLHCAVTLSSDGRVSVADLGSTNGTTLDGARVGERPVRLVPGALLQIGESTLRLASSSGSGPVETAPDGEGHVRVTGGASSSSSSSPTSASPASSSSSSGPVGVPTQAVAAPGSPSEAQAQAQAHGRSEPLVPGQGGAPGIEREQRASRAPGAGSAPGSTSGSPAEEPPDGLDSGTRKGTPLRGTDVPRGVRRRGGLGAWARRLTGGREQSGAGHDPYEYDCDDDDASYEALSSAAVTAVQRLPETWPDPAALLLTALGPGPRLWERGPDHPEALTVRLGTTDRAAPDGSGTLPAVPVTTALREVGALGLAGPRARLLGLARALVAQLAALHSPDTLELVLISADRHLPARERTADWAWLGWLPHLRPAHGQDCRLLLAYDRDQATARVDELLRRVEDHAADRAARPESEAGKRAARRPSWARDDDPAAAGFAGPYTVVIVDGDPGGADVREAVVRLAQEGPGAGIHVVCLAEAEAASPASPVTETYAAACEASPAFRACGAVALLSGDVATALRLLRVAPKQMQISAPSAAKAGGRVHARGADAAVPASRPHPDADAVHVVRPGSGRPSRPEDPGDAMSRTHTGLPAGADDRTHPGTEDFSSLLAPEAAPPGLLNHGTVATLDAVSAAWAERFARALAPLVTDAAAGDRQARVSAPLPQSARLLDELGLARATPASLMARWADAADDPSALGGRAWAVLGAGPRGPVSVDLVAEGPHLLIEGPAGSGRTELLRSVAASLAAAERPDRLGIALVDGGDGKDGLGVCTDLPHVGTHLVANDPVRMREFAQSLSAELKRRAELLDGLGFAQWHTRREVSGRLVSQRSGSAGGQTGAGASGAADIDSPSSSTLRLRPGAGRRSAEEAGGKGSERASGLPRLVVIVDDLDALLSPALGSPGRPAAGSVVRALEAVVREGLRLGVHLIAAGSEGAGGNELGRVVTLRVSLSAPLPGPDEPAPGRGELVAGEQGRATPFQAGRVTGRIPRTATLRPTVVPVEWARMGDPPARRPVRELGNGPTDLALLASALERAAREVSAAGVLSLL